MSDSPTLLPAGLDVVPGARLVAGAGQAEMHIDLRSAAFGNIEVHTTVHESQVGLAVGSDRGDLHTFLSAEVPGLQAAFRQQDLRFDQIHFLGPGGTASGLSAGADAHSGFQRPGHLPPSANAGSASVERNANDPEIAVGLGPGLNVHA